jgi:hypothetical protein
MHSGHVRDFLYCIYCNFVLILFFVTVYSRHVTCYFQTAPQFFWSCSFLFSLFADIMLHLESLQCIWQVISESYVPRTHVVTSHVWVKSSVQDAGCHFHYPWCRPLYAVDLDSCLCRGKAEIEAFTSCCSLSGLDTVYFEQIITSSYTPMMRSWWSQWGKWQLVGPFMW